MAQPKTAIVSYGTNWAKIRSWATEQKLPTSAVNNVYALDQSRMQSGYQQMSNAERTRAILAAAGMNYNTALPTDQPGASDVIGNTIRNAQGIFTGLMPNRLFSNIWGTVKTTVKDIEHPAQAGGLGKILTDTLAAWIPGAYDVGEVMQAGGLEKGLEKLATQPLSSILDVMPILAGGNAAIGALTATGRVDDAALAAATRMAGPRISKHLPELSKSSTAIGRALANNLGITPKAVAQMGGVRMMGKRIGRIQIGKTERPGFLPSVPGNVAANMERIRVPTVSDRMAEAATKIGVGKMMSHAAHTYSDVDAIGTYEMRNRRKDLAESVGKDLMTDQDRETFNGIMESNMGRDNLINLTHDEKVSINVRKAIDAYMPWYDWHHERAMASGMIDMLQIREVNPSTGLEEVHSLPYQMNEFNKLRSIQQRAEKAANDAATASQEFDALGASLDQAEAAYAPIRANLAEVQKSLTDSMGVTGAYVRKSFTDLLGSVIGTDGLLHQMDAAFRAKNWDLYRTLANKGVKKLESPKFAGETSGNVATLRSLLDTAQQHAREMKTRETAYKRAWEGKASKANERAARFQKMFLKAVHDHPPVEYDDVMKKEYYKSLLASDKAEALLDAAAQKLGREKSGFSQKEADQLRRSSPQRLFEIIRASADAMFHDPFLPNMTPTDHWAFMQDALNEVESLRARGQMPMWVPKLRATDIPSKGVADRLYVQPMKYPSIKSALKRAWDGSSTTNDVMMGVNRATAELLGKDASIEANLEVVKPMLLGRTELEEGVRRELKAREELTGNRLTVPGVYDHHIEQEWGYLPYSATELFNHTGLSPEELGLDPNETYYLPAVFKKQLSKLVGDQFPIKGAWDFTTGVFKNSILMFSPRFLAHVLFGGAMLVMGRIAPGSFRYVHEAAKMVRSYHAGELTTEKATLFHGATQWGSPDQDWSRAAGATAARWNIEEMVKNHPWMSKAEAALNINYKFTRLISEFQTSLAYLDGIRRAEKTGYWVDPMTGDRVPMTPDRAHYQGTLSAEKVMGNLQAMTPLERGIARKIMPFYGWTKHILQYVLTYPTDHPWRTMFLSTLATQNSDNFASGLDTRLQLLLFLGQPDINGNVTGIDIRAVNPFRDVANYATFQGWFSALNPILTAPVEAVDPNLIYGGNTLYPSVSYNQLYGTNVAAPSGGLLTAAEQEIPEIGALDQALGLSAQARAVKKQGGTAGLKDMLSSLGFPWLPQKLNLQQISAKHEIDRYNQAKTDALNAWQSGDFSTLDKYPGMVPDPLQTNYNITPKELEKQYQQALKAHPGLKPSESVASLPAPSL